MNRRFNLAENENPDQNQQENQPRMGAGFFVIMMLAFPLQYYLTDSYGVSVGARNQNAFTFIKNTRYVVENYLTPNAIKTNWANLNVALENYVEQFENSRKQSKKQQNTLYSGDGESPAHEVFGVLGGPNGHFAHSSHVRHRQLGDGVEYYVGQIFKHKKYGYYGVIIGWDRQCRAPQDWKQQMLGSRWKITEKQPFYSVLTTQNDSRYVAQENIELVAGSVKMTASKNVAQRLFENNHFVQDYFDFYDEATETFQPRPAIRVIYPDD